MYINREVLTFLHDIDMQYMQRHEETILFRGEPEHYPRVTSGLYRAYPTNLVDMNELQQIQLTSAKGFTKETDDVVILTQLQHLGAKTNMIDFTRDINVALFFACEPPLDRDGRVILMSYNDNNEAFENINIVHPKGQYHMVDAQKSVFVSHPKGYLAEETSYRCVNIPAGLKDGIRVYLAKAHAVTYDTVFNDISGYIRLQDQPSMRTGLADFIVGVDMVQQSRYSDAIEQLSPLIDRNISGYLGSALYHRGVAYWNNGERESAVADFAEWDRYGYNAKPELPTDIRKLVDDYKKKLGEEREIQRQIMKQYSNKNRIGTDESEYLFPEHTNSELCNSEDPVLCVNIWTSDGTSTDVLFEFTSISGYSYSQVYSTEKQIPVTIPHDFLHVTTPEFEMYNKGVAWILKDGYE